METLDPVFTDSGDIPPEAVQFIVWLTSLVKDTNAPPAAAANLDIGIALKERLPWIDDPDLSETRQRLLELLARLSLSLFQNTFEINALRTCKALLEKVRQGTNMFDNENVARLYHLYSQALYQSFLRGLEVEELDKAIELAEDSVMRTEILRLERQLDLWTYLSTKARSDDKDKMDILTRSVEIAERVRNALMDLEDHGGRKDIWLRSLNNLGMSYQIRWDQMPAKDYRDLEMSVEIGLELCHELDHETDQPDAQVEAFGNLSYRLIRAYGCYVADGSLPACVGQTTGEGLLDQAVLYLERSIAIPCERSRSHIEISLTFVDYLHNLPETVRAVALGRTYRALSSCVNRLREMSLYAGREDLLECLGTFYGISRFAAAAALETGAEPYEALKLLDEGRGIALSIQLDSRADDVILKNKEPRLCAAYAEARNRLSLSVSEGASLYERDLLVKSVLELQKRIRCAIPDFELTPSPDLLVNLARDATIVVVNITNIRSDAFIVSETGITSIPLLGLDEKDLISKSTLIQENLDHGLQDDDLYSATFNNLVQVLKKLWDSLVRPVLAATGHLKRHVKGKKWPHICWIPTGVLCLYPIHAAGGYKAAKPNDMGAMSRIISSYAPTLKILFRTYSRHHEAGSLLPGLNSNRPLAAVIALSETPPSSSGKNFQKLEAERDVSFMQETFPTMDANNKSLCNVHPKRADALELLKMEVPIVVFSCHGDVDYDEPLNSMLLLEDWETDPLTVRDLASLDLSKSKVAFLSACFTAHGGVEKFQDEVNHLACGLHLGGFANVMGSLWKVGNDNAFLIMKEFFKRLAHVGEGFSSRDVAEALHSALTKLLEETRTTGNNNLSDPLLWAPFVHFGL